jgi:nucleoside-diphosphate-sugar epimerase
MEVFVTGASGFIGAHVTRALLAGGHSVTALVVPGDSLWRLKEATGKFSVVTGQLSDRETLRRALNEFRPEACIHLAWFAEPGKYLSAPENIASLTDSLSLLHELIQAGCRQVIMVGTCAEYDTDKGFLREDTPARPTTLYAATKLSVCLIGQQLAAAAQINFAWGRIFYPYGPQEDPRRLVPAAIRALQQGRSFPATLGEQVRDYIYIEDVAAAFRVMLEKKASGVFNVSSGAPVTIRQLLETIAVLVGRADLTQFGALAYRDWEPPFIYGDNNRLKQLGWRPEYTLSQGLSQTIKWWEQNSEIK